MAARRELLILAALGLLPGAAAAQATTVQVQRPWARATPGGGRSGAVYLTLLDRGGPDRLTGAATPVADSARLHESYDDHGIARMRMLDGLTLPPGRPIVLKPGGMHIMLTGLKQPLTRGGSFPLTLTFGKAPPVTVSVTVMDVGADGPAMMPGMKMP